ncbi:DUF5994 family protein [Kutzneria sp. NPDC051319]|uniref:DUF5994 family protein n=1 Tax=Kutzneria sp. NPDC051319 TaxID=3155047 RepID=UPI003447021D
MTSGPHSHSNPAPSLRLRLKPKGPVTGYVDGGWWPHSRDLAAELPELAAVLSVRLGPIQRIAYAMDTWETAPNRVDVDGRHVRMEGFRSQDRDTVAVTGLNGQRLSLLVVPPDAGDTAGHDAMMAAAHRDNADSPSSILRGARVRRGAATSSTP